MLHPIRFAAFALAVANLGACQKKSVDPNEICISYPPDTTTQLLGRWELTEVTNGMNGRTYPADPAQRHEIVFDASGQARMFLNGTVQSTAPFSLRQAPSYITRQPEMFIVYGAVNGSTLQFIAALSSSTLTIAIDAADGGSQTYTRRSL